MIAGIIIARCMKRAFVGFCVLSFSVGFVRGQATAKPPTTLPTTRPVVQPLSADSILSRMLQPSRTAQPLQPIAEPALPDATSGFGAVAPKAPVVPLRAEGTYLINRLARLGEKVDGFRQLIFDSDGRAMQDPPMLILPNELLASMEAQTKGSSDPMAFRISGMVTQYGNRNYILIDKAVPEPRK